MYKKLISIILLATLCSCTTSNTWELHNYTNTYQDDEEYKESITLKFNTETGETQELDWDEDGNLSWKNINDQK